MPVELYPSTHYPPYAQGYAYILTKKSVSLLLDTFRQNKAPMIWVEDSYITGLLRKGIL